MNARYSGKKITAVDADPFLLAMENAVVYEIDNGIVPRRRTELPGVRPCYDFFMKHSEEF